MQETLSDRIRKLRKEKGFTQLKLAEMLNITDKAVSKWELGDGNPDISLLPKLSKIFGVSTDYILTGVLPDESASLDNMDETKRAIYLIQKDDVEGFVKYGYNKINALFSPYKNWGLYNFNQQEIHKVIRKEIYNYQSINIFKLLLDDFIGDKKYTQFYQNTKSPAALKVYNDIDDFIKMCAISNRLDGLELIKIHLFAIGNKQNQTTNQFRSYQDPNQTYLIKESTLKFIYEDSRVSEEIIQYISTLHFYNGRDNSRHILYYFLNDYLLFYMYKYERLDLLEKEMEKLNNNINDALKKHPNALGSETYDVRYVQKHDYPNHNCFYTLGQSYRESSQTNISHVIEPIKKALDEALKNFDIKWIEIFNEYNKKIAINFSKSQQFLDENEINILKMKANPSVSNNEILVYKHTKLNILDVTGLLNSLLINVDDVDSLRKTIKEAKNIYTNYILKSYIHYCEMIEDLLKKEDYKTLFQFSVDNNLPELEDAIINRKHDTINQISRRLFYCDPKTLNEGRNAIIYKRSKSKPEAFASIVINLNPHLKKNIEYKNCLLNQSSFYNFNENDVDNFFESCKKIKREIYDQFITNVENRIEILTGEKKAKIEYEKICSDINEDYLNSLIINKQFETTVIKLSVKLEAKLKYVYKYEGELKEMIDLFIQNNRVESAIAVLLNKLRMVRNGIVHSTSQNETLSVDELINLIKIIENIKGVA